MKASTIEASPEFLRHILKLPEWVRITGAEWRDHRVVLRVEGRFCPDVGTMSPVYRRNDDGSVVLVEMQGADT